MDATGHRWVAAISNYTFSIIYKSGKCHQDVADLSRIQWPEEVEMNSQIISTACEGVQVAHGKAEILCHSTQTLGILFSNDIQDDISLAN